MKIVLKTLKRKWVEYLLKILVIILSINGVLNAQNLSTSHQSTNERRKIIGFWEINKVQVGAELMTPVAKWTKINEDLTYQSGNGWLQNSEGTWNYDEKSKQFLLQEKNGIKDEYGAFTINFSGDKMTWERDEDGMKVVVSLDKIDKLPRSPTDMITGLWDLVEVSKENVTITSSFDQDNQHYIFFRWDRIYVERTPQGERTTGYWHMNGHRPEITLISHNEEKESENWRLTVNDSELRLFGISESNQGLEMIYKRINEFPE